VKWDDVLRACIATLRADAQLQSLLGTDYTQRIKRNSSGPVTIPSVTYQVITNPLAENTESMTVQWDIWASKTASANEYATAVAIEERLTALMHNDVILDLDGVQVFGSAVDSRDHADPETNVAHRSCDFEYTFAKEEA
jgi:hypothetical protein